MSNAAKILAKLEAEQTFLSLHQGKWQTIAKDIPGWSGVQHYIFFRSVLAAIPAMRDVLIIGVYMGRDIALMSAGCPRNLNIVGVDKFSDTPCDDWPEIKRMQSWTDAGYGMPPSLERAHANLSERLPVGHNLRLIEADDAAWLPSVTGKFDLIFLDTSHDKATVLRQLAQVAPLCHDETIIAGDDYANIEPTWGVKDAVSEATREHHVLADTIWFCDAGELK